MAGEDGLAVMSLGIAENISVSSFRNNSFFCPSGKYGLTEDYSELVEVRPCPKYQMYKFVGVVLLQQ